MKKLLVLMILMIVLISVNICFADPNCPTADLTGDCFVDLEDLDIMSSQWLVCPSADLTGDCFVDFEDFAIISLQWLEGMLEDQNLIAHWQMDDDAASTLVEDSSGYGNDGTAQQNTNQLNTTGIVGDALSFNGNSDYIDIGSNPIPSLGDWTLAGWVYCEGALGGTTDDWATVFGSGSWSGSAVQGVVVYIRTGNLRVSIGNGASDATAIPVTDITGANADTWYHVAVAYDSTNTEAKVYVDGAYSLTIDHAYAQSNINFTIGNSLGLHVSESYWYGKIDEVRIFNEALPASEVDALYNE